MSKLNSLTQYAENAIQEIYADSSSIEQVELHFKLMNDSVEATLQRISSATNLRYLEVGGILSTPQYLILQTAVSAILNDPSRPISGNLDKLDKLGITRISSKEHADLVVPELLRMADDIKAQSGALNFFKSIFSKKVSLQTSYSEVATVTPKRAFSDTGMSETQYANRCHQLIDLPTPVVTKEQLKQEKQPV